jgi:hypothetical protein
MVINFALYHSSFVAIKFYNLSGREIACIANSHFEPGNHTVTWNAQDLSAGCYTMKMLAGSKTLTKTFPILR